MARCCRTWTLRFWFRTAVGVDRRLGVNGYTCHDEVDGDKTLLFNLCGGREDQTSERKDIKPAKRLIPIVVLPGVEQRDE